MTGINPLVMPKLGLTMTDAVLASWAVAVGSRVRTGDVLFTVETDKIATDIEARGEGEIVSLDVAEGDTVAVGALLGRWTGPSQGSEAAAPADPVHQAPAPESGAGTPAAADARVRATPLARRTAKRAGLDLAGVRGSGPDGRIKAIDVETASPAAAPATQPEQRRAATRFERIVAARLTEAKRTIPHFYAFAEADVTDLLALRTKRTRRAGKAFSVTHFLIAALARTLAEMPERNARWEDGEIVTLGAINVGVAIDGPRGTMVPVLRGADRLDLDGIAAALDRLIGDVREGTLRSEDTAGGAVSISNVGMYGATALAPIVNPGQSAILGVGKAKEIFRPDAQGRPILRRELMLILSCDHRIFDGVTAAKLLDRLRLALEHPSCLFAGA